MTRGDQRWRFPYREVAKLWHEGKTISEIAHAIGRFEDNKKDPCHSLRNFLRVMHQHGYVDASGQRVKRKCQSKHTIDRLDPQRVRLW